MPYSDDIIEALKDQVPSEIYKRGAGYFKSGKVKSWSVEKDEEDGASFIISGKVQGSETYTTTLEYDTEDDEFWEMDCSCPYGSGCKHAVALGLAFARWLDENPDAAGRIMSGRKKETQPEISSEQQINENRLREALRDLGIREQNIPENMIAQLLEYREDSSITPAAKTKVQKTAAKQKSAPLQASGKPFNPKDYYITLKTYDGYTPALFKRTPYYEKASISKILQRNDISSAQKELLSYIKNGNFENYSSQKPDPAILFPLLAGSGFPIYENYRAPGDKELAIDINPKPLQAEIVYEPRPMQKNKAKIRHDFFFRMPEIYWKNMYYRWENPFHAHDSCLIRKVEKEKTIELYKLTPLLTKIISRVSPVGDYEDGARKIEFYQAKLAGEEMVQFDRLCEDASSLLDLACAPPLLKPQAMDADPHPAFVVDFDSAAQFLHIAPAINYGAYNQDISESISRNEWGKNVTLVRRQPYENPGTHIIAVKDDIIHYAEIDGKKELGFYKAVEKKAFDLGFTKTLKCRKNGSKQLTEYLRTSWPALVQYAKEKECPILFTKDELALEQQAMRADFATDMDADNDWLYFDMSVYCGEERVTLEKLLDFLESGESFWRKDDGTLVEISNRQELERLARMLKSFHARENGGFEGRLYHAPELEYIMTSSEYYDCQRAKSFDNFLKQVKKGRPVKKVRLPKKLNKTLRPYQKAGIEWIYFLRSYRFAGILADDMGLGKTLQTLAVLDMEKVEGKPSIVVCPKTLLYNWQLEAEKFFPKLKVLVYDGNPADRRILQNEIEKHDLIVMSYGTLKQDDEQLSGFKFNYAVLDEAQFIKNHKTKNAQTAKKINADYRLALTGTPLENSVSEIWSIYDFLMPGFLGNYAHFSDSFHKPIMDRSDREALEHLRRKVECFMLRRTKAQVLKELPPKIETVSHCHLSEPQNILYQQILAKVRGEVFGTVEKKGFKSAQIHILAGLTKLRQACNHPALLVKDKKGWQKYKSAKLDMCMELVDEVAEGKQKVLIFSQFTQMLDIVSAALNERGIKHLYLSGRTKDRQVLVDTFNNDPDFPVFLISMKAGGTGLNLTSADTVIIFDPWWNPSVENQAIDRAHRIGQTKNVNVYRLLTSGTIEEKIQALKQKKQHLFDAMVAESGDMFKKLTWDDIQELFAD